MLSVLPGAPPAAPPPETCPYQPRGGALDLLLAHDPEVLIEGPANTGKSRAALEKLHLCAGKYPGMRGLIVRQTRESCTESVLVTFETKVVPPGHPILRGPDRANRQRYTYPNGSEIVVAGLVAHSKDNRAKVMSTEYDLIYAAEATELREDDAEKLTTRLRNKRMPYQQIIFDVNPTAPTHWLNQRANRGQLRRILSRHRDNPTFTAQDQAFLDRLTGVRRDRLRDGKWGAAEGLVYPEWDAAVHLIDPFPIPAAWPRRRAIDFGYTNPFVCQWWATDPDGRAYLYRELLGVGRRVTQWGAEILELTGDERIEETVADHDAEDRATLDDQGVPTVAAKKEVSPGVQAVTDRLVPAGDGRPRLYVLRGSLVRRDPVLIERKAPQGWAEEIEAYCWPLAGDGKPQKEAPVKQDDHSMDTGRYLVARLDLSAPREVSWA